MLKFFWAGALGVLAACGSAESQVASRHGVPTEVREFLKTLKPSFYQGVTQTPYSSDLDGKAKCILGIQVINERQGVYAFNLSFDGLSEVEPALAARDLTFATTYVQTSHMEVDSNWLRLEPRNDDTIRRFELNPTFSSDPAYAVARIEYKVRNIGVKFIECAVSASLL